MSDKAIHLAMSRDDVAEVGHRMLLVAREMPAHQAQLVERFVVGLVQPLSAPGVDVLHVVLSGGEGATAE